MIINHYITNLEIDADVKSVLEIMQQNMPANKLVAVAAQVNALAPMLWGDHQAEGVAAIRLVSHPLTLDDDQRKPLSAI